MDPKINDIDNLLGKYLANETSGEEEIQVQRWLSESEANLEYFNHLKLIFDRAAKVNDIPQFNTDQAWNSLKRKIEGRGKVVSIGTRKPFDLYWRVAASIALFAAFGFFTYKLMQPSVSTVELQAESKITIDTLPDGSEVALNRKTRLVYSFDKKANRHRAKLKGEAFFKINHEEQKDFIVDADGVFVKDIGTSFDVKAYPELKIIEVNVHEGEVKFFTETSDGITVKAGEKGIFNKETRQFSSDRLEPNVAAYKTKYFVYTGTTLAKVVDELNSVYDKRLVIADHLRECQLTVTFNNETIEEIATVIAETLGLTVSESANEIVLEGSGCE